VKRDEEIIELRNKMDKKDREIKFLKEFTRN
jgi:hypothetical protein